MNYEILITPIQNGFIIAIGDVIPVYKQTFEEALKHVVNVANELKKKEVKNEG